MESTVSTRMGSSHSLRRHSLRLVGSPFAAWKAVSLKDRITHHLTMGFLQTRDPTRPDTVTLGTNTLVGRDLHRLRFAVVESVSR